MIVSKTNDLPARTTSDLTVGKANDPTARAMNDLPAFLGKQV